MSDTERVVDEGRVKLAAEVFARCERQLGRKYVTMDLRSAGYEICIQAAQKIR